MDTRQQSYSVVENKPTTEPIRHICDLPHYFTQHKETRSRGTTESQRFIQQFYDGGLKLPSAYGLHGFKFAEFMVTLTDQNPVFVLEDHPKLLEELARSQFFMQPGQEATPAGGVVGVLRFQDPDASQAMEDAALRPEPSFAPRLSPGKVGDTKNVLVLNWFLMGVNNQNTTSIGLSVGQKYGSLFRCESGPAFATGSGVRRDLVSVFYPGEKNMDTMRMLSRPNYDDIYEIMRPVDLQAEDKQNLDEVFSRTDNDPTLRSMRLGSVVTRELLASWKSGEDGVVQTDIIQTVGGYVFAKVDVIERIREKLKSRARRLQPTKDLKNLGKVFCRAESLVFTPPNVAPVPGPAPKWSITLKLGFVYAYTTCEYGNAVSDYWFVSLFSDVAA